MELNNDMTCPVKAHALILARMLFSSAEICLWKYNSVHIVKAFLDLKMLFISQDPKTHEQRNDYSIVLLSTTETTSTYCCSHPSPAYLFLLNKTKDNIKNILISTLKVAILLITISHVSFWHCTYASRVPDLLGFAVWQQSQWGSPEESRASLT